MRERAKVERERVLKREENAEAERERAKVEREKAKLWRIEMMDMMKRYSTVCIIQRSFRVYSSKCRMNAIRSIPENIFSSEFGEMRKKLLGIDDSKFGDQN